MKICPLLVLGHIHCTVILLVGLLTHGKYIYGGGDFSCR